MARFKTRARTVDLLGRQQIAGIPTAISELFKNAHDAYADHVEVDYYRSDRLFVLRDDGVGMTREDFEDRWLVLGTESKLGEKGGVEPPYVPENEERRPTLGEKGIGRLAVAAISPQVLALSRARREDGLHDLVASFIHWGIFEASGINLDAITIPVRTFPAGTVPDCKAVKELVDEFRTGLTTLSDKIDPELRKRIEKDLGTFDVDPLAAEDYLLGPESLSLKDKGAGTHFYLRPADEILDDLLAEDRESKEAPPLVRTLIGFSNTMTPKHPPSRVKTAFRDHQAPDSWTDRIARDEFFTPEEFQDADHQFVGTFDERGRFEGEVTVYGEKHHHVVESPLKGRARCGPFDVALAYVMGKQEESTLPDSDYVALVRKLERIGGLYVYRDGVRILPYGDPQFDFLGFEERRLRGAGYYFFSYRRMFGAVTLSREQNATLREKAGREGFIEDRAYADFRRLLRNLFIQLAADFFRKSAPDRTFEQRREELKREDKARKHREVQTRAAHKELKEALAKVVVLVEQGEPTERVEKLLDDLRRSAEAALESADPVRAVGAAEAKARSALADLRRRYEIRRPENVGLPSEILEDLARYTEEYARVETETLRPAEAQIEQIATEAAQAAGASAANRSELEQPVEEEIEARTEQIEKEASKVAEKADEVRDSIRLYVADAKSEWTNKISSARQRLNEVAPASQAAAALRSLLIRELREASDHEVKALASLFGQLDALSLSRDPSDQTFGIAETLAAVESELYALRERETTDAELVQLGQALNVIDHELGDSATSIRDGLRRLKGWADANPDLREAYDAVRIPFEHLDSQLKLFTPLRRRLYRSRVEFTGRQIAKFLNRLFERRLNEDDIKLDVTKGFEQYEFFGFPSSVYPAFINLVDNALYWLKERPKPRIVTLDVDDGAALVSDNGPGIPDRDRERIFEPGFTRKRFGRGLGLAVARQALADTDYTLTLDATDSGNGATFRITPDPSTD